MSARVAAANVRLKRAYASVAADDGTRILVDRLWPRGVSKADAAIDLWLKDLAPSSGLRTWFGHDPARWAAFQARYRGELDLHRERLMELRDLARNGTITLVYAAHDEAHNNAVVVRKRVLGRK